MEQQKPWNTFPWNSLTSFKSMSDVHFGFTEKKQYLENQKEKKKYPSHTLYFETEFERIGHYYSFNGWLPSEMKYSGPSQIRGPLMPRPPDLPCLPLKF